MNALELQQFNDLLAKTSIKPRLKNELRFVRSTDDMSEQDWHDRELVAITDRSGNKGVLLVCLNDSTYIIPYELSSGLTSKSGKSQPIICDFCRTWQTGSRSGSIRFPKNSRTQDSVSYLCCSDLLCSLHVRSKTNAAKTSRSQLREDLSTDQRIDRLQIRLRKLVADLKIVAV